MWCSFRGRTWILGKCGALSEGVPGYQVVWCSFLIRGTSRNSLTQCARTVYFERQEILRERLFYFLHEENARVCELKIVSRHNARSVLRTGFHRAMDQTNVIAAGTEEQNITMRMNYLKNVGRHGYGFELAARHCE